MKKYIFIIIQFFLCIFYLNAGNLESFNQFKNFTMRMSITPAGYSYVVIPGNGQKYDSQLNVGNYLSFMPSRYASINTYEFFSDILKKDFKIVEINKKGKVKELTDWLDSVYPSDMAEHWDNVGLLVGGDDAEVTHVFLALDLTETTLEEAVRAGADMIITHHPMIFEGQKKINNHSFTGRRILKLIRNRIQYYAMHTNYDVLGMAELSADYLKLTDREVLSVTAHTEQGEEGFGRVGCLPYKMTLKECGEFVKEALALNDVRIYGDPDTMVEKAAICTGSGKSMISDVLAKGADVYVTGDIDHHTGIDAVASGLPIIDAGHYGTEYIFMKAMRKILEEKYPSLQITCAKVKSPYMIL